MRLLIFLQLFISSIALGQNYRPDSIYYKPEILAKFKYGDDELNNFILVNTKIPYNAMWFGINGQVILTVVIDTTGNFQEIKIVKETDDAGLATIPEYAYKDHNNNYSGVYVEETKRVLMLLSGLFDPAINNGIHVVSALSLTFNFTTQQYKKNQRDYQKQIYKENKVYDFDAFEATYNIAQDTIRYNNGVTKLTTNKFDLSCKYFEEAIRLNPKYIDAYYNIGVAYLKLGKKDKACEAWGTAKELGDKEVPSLIEKYCNQ